MLIFLIFLDEDLKPPLPYTSIEFFQKFRYMYYIHIYVCICVEAQQGKQRM